MTSEGPRETTDSINSMTFTPNSLLRVFLLENPTSPWWISALLWVIRIATISLFLRSYLFPLILSAVSKHVRIRSVSFFSIRGLFIRAGPRIIRVDRVRYSFSFAKGINVTLDGVNVEVGSCKAKVIPKHTRHDRRLTLADFAPSPMAHRLWNIASSAYSVVEPHFRPLIRTCVVAALRLLIRWLPHIISRLYFEAHSTTATFTDLPGTSVSAGTLTLHVNLSFTDLESVIDTSQRPKPRSTRSRRSYGMAAWRKRFAASFQRTLDRAWGNTQGNASIAVRLHNIAGSTLPESSRMAKTAQFLHLPEAIDFDASLRFNPREGTADDHSLEVSLNIGDCSVELDTLKLLLQSLKSKETVAVPKLDLEGLVPPLQFPKLHSSPSSTSPDTEMEGFFSPLSSTFSHEPELSSYSAGLSSAVNLSPSSPFLEKLSASIRPRRRIPYKPCTRLKSYKKTSRLSVLRNGTIKISSITLATQNKWGLDPYQLKVHDIVLGSSICTDSSEDDFQRRWLGNRRKIENCDPDIYAFKFWLAQVAVERRTRLDSMRLLTLETVNFQAIVTQWPAPWLTPSPFMAGDPNGPFLAIRAKLGGLDVTERLERLRELVAHIEPSTKGVTLSRTSADSFKIPRIVVEAECGILRGRVICADTRGTEPFALEVRNNGFVFSMETSFIADFKSTARPSGHAKDLFRIYYKFFLVLEPTLVRVRPRTHPETRKFTQLRSHDTDFLEDHSILSIESFEILEAGHAIASMDSEEDCLASVFTHSPISELHISTDVICVEAWNSNVVAALQQLSSVVPPQDDQPPPPPLRQPFLDRMLPGLSITVIIPRFVVIVTSPDVNPQDNLDLSRGVAFRTSLSLSYCYMHASHVHRFHDLNECTTRRGKLHLPPQHLIGAISAARTSVISEKASAHIKVSFSNLALRSAVSTQYDADNPFVFERDDPDLEKQEFLSIPSITIDLCLSGKRGAVASKAGETCDVSVVVPDVKATFQLAYVYSSMLAMQCIKDILPKSSHTRAVTARPSFGSKTKIVIVVSTVQIRFELQSQRLVARIDDIGIHAPPERPPSMQLRKLVIWVCLAQRVMKWEDERGERWEEFMCFRTLKGSLASSHVSPSLSINGESARLRIPHGYIFADFVTDAVVTMKAMRHLSRITAQHLYTPMPTPEPEEPKHVLRIVVHLRCLCLEAADDPFESNLSVLWRCGYHAAKQRIDREEAYKAKVAAIYQAESQVPHSVSVEHEADYHFGGDHSVPIDEARRRLDEVHELDWTLRLQDLRQVYARSDEAMNQLLRGKHTKKDTCSKVPDLIEASPIPQATPLFRALFRELFLDVHRPSFPGESLSDYLYEQGGLPRDTKFSLLVPLHLNFTLTSLHITLRDYPLPLVSIPATNDHTVPAWVFETDLVVAEEMGNELSVDWIDTVILEPHHGATGASAFSISVPKTIMPVKTYANPVVHVNTTSTTILSWSMSYTPAIQDLMKVIENLTPAPRDSSPGIGFWDKMRLIFHWTFVVIFKGEVRFHLKGSRDPYQLDNEGAGFVLTWLGNTKLLIARKNEDRELMQVISDSMFIAIPNLEHLYPRNQQPSFVYRTPETSNPFRKIIAKVRSGVRFGVGFVLERACGDECNTCSGSAFHRKCRYFEFLPHHQVRLEKKVTVPSIKSPGDSYNGFRSDFIHLSISLTSSTRTAALGLNQEPSSIHLTPKAFAHFWSWCSLFDGTLSLPTRQGSYYPPRHVSPKFTRHLATLKYRLSIRNLYVMHAYIDESRETWVDGITPWIGAKGMIEELHADMHQRDEETVVPDLIPNATKVLRRKPVYAAEVSLKGLDLRVLLAIFKEPLLQEIEMIAPPQRSNYRAHKDLPTIPSSSAWFDKCDFVETDWSPSTEPKFHLLPFVSCPQFTYFKRKSVLPHNSTLSSKFGSEGSHSCLLGKSLSVSHVQIAIAQTRLQELRKLMKNKGLESNESGRATLAKMVTLLEEYVLHLRGVESKSRSAKYLETIDPTGLAYSISPDEWAEFENVYHCHCPKVFLDSAVKDVILQYYYCSRARRGLEYHMATRAVKFIRDQADAALDDDSDTEESQERRWEGTDAAQMAASALRKIFKCDLGRPSVEVSTQDRIDRPPEKFNALDGWSEGVSLRKSHFCLLLKPQIVMRGEDPKDSIILAAVQARLQVFAIMDNNNVNDPVSGKIMSRSDTSLSGLQTFAPTSLVARDSLCVPYEVLIDPRCESSAFDQLVPQTDAVFRYDKFNRLRLRNNVTSVTRASCGSSHSVRDRHLQDETDLIRVHIPRFTVSASDKHFKAISHVITQLLLFSDAAHKTRLEKLETLLFTYDFTDLVSAARVVANLQARLGEAHEAQKAAEYNHSRRLEKKEGQLELLKLKAHVFLLCEELNLLFDAIKLAQDRHDDHSDRKSAVLLHASSDEISWKMLDDRRELLAKLVVQSINFNWLNRRDSSTSNDLSVRNLTAFDGSRYAIWPEIVSKYEEPANHPLLKRGLFLIASWTELAPVGGIIIYESFEMSLHPIRLQIDARVGRRIMEYMWPARKYRHVANEEADQPLIDKRMSIDSPRALHGLKSTDEMTKEQLMPSLRKLGTSRSFSDLRGSCKDTSTVPTLKKIPSSDSLFKVSLLGDKEGDKNKISKRNDAAEMKTRTSQRSFVLVKISSMNLLLSIVKEGSFECHEARIKTRDLEYRNQTWSFEELVNQFIPSNTSWRGWVKMAFHQPLLPVLPVARELISKTKWKPSSSKTITPFDVIGPPTKLSRARVLCEDDDSRLVSPQSRGKSKSPSQGRRIVSSRNLEPTPPITSMPFSDEPESFVQRSVSAVEVEKPTRSKTGQARMMSLFKRGATKGGSVSSSTIHRSE